MNALIYRALSRRRVYRNLSELTVPAAEAVARMTDRILPAGSALLLTLALTLYPPASHADTTVDERRSAEADGFVEIINVSGEIEVSGWDEDELTVTGTLGRGVERLDIEADGDRIRIEVIYPNIGRSEGSDLKIRLPRNSSLEVRTVSADIDVGDVRGRQRLNSVSGDISTELYGNDLEAETVSGDLEVEGDGQPTIVALKTVSGNIEASDLVGEVEAGSVSGRIQVDAGMLDRARLGTTSGRMTLEGGLSSGGRYDLSSTSGRVNVLLDDDADIDLDAQSFSGDIENCFGVESSRNGYSPERSLRLRDGAGNRTVRIRTMSSDISICAESRTH
jgi:DUF4097 and DUF4098 domain-containing protein YvlB